MQPTIQPVLETERLILRPRTVADLEPTAAMNADPEVMRFIAPVGDPMMGVAGLAERSFSHVAQGLGYWSVGRRDGSDDFLGYVGLLPQRDGRREVELSYRFERRHWGRGYAFEAVRSLLGHAFGGLALPEIVILTHPLNGASLRLAARLGFGREVDRPSWMMGDPQFSCAFCRLTQAAWTARSAASAGARSD
ncbi:N-acetyltransferase [Bosea caraganae]|uniref:N-acetyltransferase n=1 Tax=Bosea caraganae TaxID=2763117 RepID=A0A370L349_9HYPH|nr:GNAT family N-acetyltransferase [Bosea caraganae]RDJ22854.1 N-acetyltransferase [Bosea caraganae]RDJ28633.1 N-acetyltransferase [Bosea caraganae]